MEEEIKEFAPLENGDLQELPKFDPNKKYTWTSDAQFVVTGAQFGTILNALRAVINTQEAQTILLASDAAEAIEAALVKSVESGLVKEAPQAPTNSL